MPGRGGGGACACPGTGRVCWRRATRSGRGGTTGRAAGCPARFGRICCRSGTLGAGADGLGLVSTTAGLCGAGRGIAGTCGAGLGMPGAADATTGVGAVGATDAGRGCRGPDRICPGRGDGGAGGTGLAGIAPPRMGGWIGGPPVDSGGRIGDGLTRGGSSAVGMDTAGSACAAAAGAGCS